VISKVRSVTMNEIAARRRRKKTLITDFDETIGHELRLGLMQARRRIRREEAPAPQDATRLPERLP
jgi:hypothetical protein